MTTQFDEIISKTFCVFHFLIVKFVLNLQPDIDFSDFTLWKKVKYIIVMPPFIVMWMSASFRFMGGYALGSWIQVFYRRVYGISPTTISLWLAVIIPVGGLAASYLGGTISDSFKKRFISAPAWVLSSCSILAIPFLAGTLFSDKYQISFLFLLGEYLFAEMWLGPAITIIQDITPPTLRTISSAIYFLSLAIGGLSPFLVGWMIEWFAIDAPYQDNDSESKAYDPTYPMIIVIGGSYFLSAIGFAVVAFLLKRRKIVLENSSIL